MQWSRCPGKRRTQGKLENAVILTKEAKGIQIARCCAKNWTGLGLTKDIWTAIWSKMHDVCMLSRFCQCPTLCDPMDCSLPGSSIHGIVQERTLEWVAISSSRGSSQCRDWTQGTWFFCIGRRILYRWATWQAHKQLVIAYVKIYNRKSLYIQEF